jgi:hypothetical protein
MQLAEHQLKLPPGESNSLAVDCLCRRANAIGGAPIETAARRIEFPGGELLMPAS